MSEELDWLEAWRGGDREAGSRLFERYFDPLFRFFRNKVDEGADDLVQQTFLACVRNLDRVRQDSSFRSYLFRVAHSKLYDHLRAKMKGRDVDFGVTSVVDMGASPSQLIVRGEEQRLLLEALRRLPLDLQVVLELYYVERIRGPELSEVLQIPEGTVRSRLRRGRELLEKHMAEIPGVSDWATSSLEDLDAWAARVRKAFHNARRDAK